MAKYTENHSLRNIITFSVLCALCAAGVVTSTVLAVQNSRLKAQISRLIEQRESYAETLDEPEEPYREEPYLGKYPMIDGAALNMYDMSLLRTDKRGRVALYSEEGEKLSRLGVDVSSHQGKIDWQAVAEDGVEFAFIRAGFRGYETGRIAEDSRFVENAEGAAAAGLDIGLYFYSQALNEQEAREEAQFLIDSLERINARVALPLVFDWELPEGENVRTEDLSGAEQTRCCEAFCTAVREAGYEAAYYASVNTAIFRYDLSALHNESLWLAQYTDEPDFPYRHDIWQFTCFGQVNGIDTYTDMNIMYTHTKEDTDGTDEA